MLDRMMERSKHYIEAAETCINRVSVVRGHIVRAVSLRRPLNISFDGDGDTIDVRLDGAPVLQVVNFDTCPITPVLDTISLARTGRLNEALDYRPFMLSGPCPISILWSSPSGSLSEVDAMGAFRYWMQSVFDINMDLSGNIL